MRIVFHGENAGSFLDGFAELLDEPAEILALPDALSSADREIYASADVIVGVGYGAALPRPEGLRLFHVPGAGYDAVDLAAVPGSAVVCNCFGHEQAIAEYVMSAILARHVPLARADALLRNGDWAYTSGAPSRVHDEMSGKTIGLLGFGHIGKAIAARAKAFEMKVVVANRGAVPPSGLVDQSFTLDALDAFWGAADYIVVSVPATPETTGMVDARAFAAMRPEAVVLNVGRGATIDARALYDALSDGSIGGAVIDTWYQYPKPGETGVLPSTLPFHTLGNIVMTPHMSGWTTGTIRRRRATMAANVNARAAGRPCVNIVRDET
jgi:phosphoglycerate dehydrogenase-like enzyme